jgi:hypothetical protein
MISEKLLKFVQQVQALINNNIVNHAKNTIRKDNLEKLAAGSGISDKTEVKELAELAIIKLARTIALANGTIREKYEKIVTLYNHQPNLTHRSSQSMIYQQYSTPAPISYIGGAWCLDRGLGGVKRGGRFTKNHFSIPKTSTTNSPVEKPTIFEPSAGNGLFTIAFSPSQAWVNEIDDFRRSILQGQGFNKVTNIDSSIPSNFSAQTDQFDIVVSNPPFDKLSKEVVFNGTEFGVLDHIMAAIALQTMKPSGRAAIIVGGHTEYDEAGRVKAGKNRKFINYLYKHYNVEDIINIDGNIYRKQGTSFNIRLILIDGKKPVKSGFAPLHQDMEYIKQQTVTTFEQLYERIFYNNTPTMNKEELTETTEFKNWFNKSKIIDKKGGPLKVYHGTNQNFTQFSKDKQGSNTGMDNTKFGFFFIADRKLAANFTKKNGGGKIIITAYLSIKKPINISIHGIFNIKSQAPTIAKIIFGKDLSEDEAFELINDEIGLGELAEMRDELHSKSAKAIILKAGYDGMISDFGDDNLEYIAFEPEQIMIVDPQPDNFKDEAEAILILQRQELDLKDMSIGDDQLGMAYIPVSDSCNRLDVDVPDSMGFETHEALRKMQLAVGGDVTEFVRVKLKYDTKLQLCKALAAEQIDAVATAIYNIEEKSQGIIIGDQTGIGKGRQAAGIIRYAICQGLTPVFLSEKPNLFSDLYRDMVDIGSADYKPFIVNAKEARTNVTDVDGVVIYMAPEKKNQQDIFATPGKLKSYDYVMSTYSQFNKNITDENGEETLDVKGNFLKIITRDSILILDESHNAGGESNIGRFLTKCVKYTKGTVFLSATFAKRPDNMPIYAVKTALQDCNLSHEDFIKAFEKGGVALQEVVSAQLVQEGQMIRRERTLDNLEVNYITLTDSAIEHTAIADKITAIMRRIVVFEELFIEDLIETADKIISGSQGEAKKTKGTSKAGVSNSPYFSKLFNVVNQMLFAIKAPEVAQHTIRQLKAGKKAIVAFSSTMGAFLSDIEVGSVINADFGEVLERGLQNTLRYSEFDSDGKSTHKFFSLSSMSQAGQKEYASIMQDIKVASTGITVSPIDILIQTIRSAGYTVAEVTGRDKELQYNFSEEQAQDMQEKQALKPKKALKKLKSSYPNCELLIPPVQLEVVKDAMTGEEGEYFISLLNTIEDQAEKLKVRSLDKEAAKWKKENQSSPLKYSHDLALPTFHYFNGSTDIYVYEWNTHDELLYSYTILNGDTQNSEFGNQALSDIFGRYGMGRDFEMDFYYTPKPVKAILNEDKFSGLGKVAPSIKNNTMALVLSRKKEDAKDSFRRFQNNQVDVLLINQSGSTGASAHAIATKLVPVSQVKRRVMIFLQPELDINRQVQKMGRINRTGQIKLPQYDYLSSIIPAEQRLMMMLQKKIKSLDANTSSNQSNSSSVIDVPDFLNKYGDKVVFDYLITNPIINIIIGDPIALKENEGEAKVPDSTILANLSHKVSGRIAILSVKDQEHFYNNVLEEYAKYVNSLRQQGKYDLEMETKDFNSLTLESTPIYINPSPGKSVFANHSYLEKVEVNNLVKPYSQFEVREKISKSIAGYNSAKDYCLKIEKRIETFAQERLEQIQSDIKEDYAYRIQKIETEKGYLKLSNSTEQKEYVNERTSELLNAQEAHLISDLDKYNNQIAFITSTIRFFIPGRSVMFPTATFEGGASYTHAIFLGFDFNLKSSNPYSPGQVYLSFAMSDSNRHFDINLANDGRVQVDMCKGASFDITSDYLEDWTGLCANSNKNRITRYMITGNLLQTITMKDYTNGKLVNYTVQGGGVSKGYIMPDKWQPNFELNQVNGKANIEVPVPVYMARDFIKKNSNSKVPIKTTTVLNFGRNYDGIFTLNMPRSKKQGGFIFLDQELLKLVHGNNFNIKGELMIATCFENKIDDVLQYLQTIHKMNIMVTTEQLKNIDIPQGITPEIQKQIPIALPQPLIRETDEMQMLLLEAEALLLIQEQELELINLNN